MLLANDGGTAAAEEAGTEGAPVDALPTGSEDWPDEVIDNVTLTDVSWTFPSLDTTTVSPIGDVPTITGIELAFRVGIGWGLIEATTIET